MSTTETRNVRTLTLFMEGKPITRHEPLIGRHGPYPHPQTKLGLQAWKMIWMANGRLHVEGFVIVEVYVRVKRPASHLRKDGEVNALGRERTVPTGFDLSNVIKLVEDALKGLAFGDDTLVASLHSTKQWATKSRPAGVEVSISRFGTGSES